MDHWQRFKQSWRMTNNWNKLLVLLTAVIAVSNGCYSCYARKQFVIMDGTLQEMKRSGQQSTNQVWQAIGNINWMARSMDWSQKQTQEAIKTSDRRSLEALNASIRASKLDERAWFGISDFKILNYDRDDAKQPFRMQIEFKNTGKTPARQIRADGFFGIHNSRTEGPSDTEWKSFLTYYAQDTARYVAAPNVTRKYIVGDFGDNVPGTQAFRDLFAKNFTSIRNGSKFLSYFGQATYIDNDGKMRATKFCLVLADIETKQLWGSLWARK